MENEVLVYDIDSNKAYCLNETSSVIWALCNGRNEFAKIRSVACKKLGAEVSEDLVWLALDELKKNDLISGEYSTNFQGMKRRDVIRKIGLASAVALPLIFSVLAPTAASAATCATNGTPCTTPVTCCGGVCSALACACSCSSPGQCISQTACPSLVNCNAGMVCAP